MAEEKRDYSDYEKRRAADHEALSRLAASCVLLPGRQCRLRLCYRNQHCSGGMAPSRHQALAVRAQREIGLSGSACADLPICIADARTDEVIQAFRRYGDALAKLRSDNTMTATQLRRSVCQWLRETNSKPEAERKDQGRPGERKQQRQA